MIRWLPLLCLTTATAAAQPPAEVEFFESKIRPILAENCTSCHGDKKQSGGLRLDTAEGLKAGGDSGAVVVAGKAKESRMIQAVKREIDSAMPPKGAIPKEQVERLVEWVNRGAHFPATVAKAATKPNAKNHWAYQPVKPVTPPAMADQPNPIDRFVVVKLQASQLTLSPSADRRTLLRRLSFDLIGLPPSYEEIQAFEADRDPKAIEKVVDRLLASPHFGERWGRHWLDVARYADSKGYVFTEDRNFPFAYTYRDYVIRAYNDDKPFSQFVIEQLAADKLDLKTDKRPLAALGYLTLGRRFLNNTHDIIDDRIDVVTRGLMGLTVACARCHDHKYDPIPAADYYSLYGIFAGSNEPKELPLIEEQTAEHKAFEIEAARKEKAAQDYADAMYATHLAPFRTAEGVATYLLAAETLKEANQKTFDQAVVDQKLQANVLERWRGYLKTPKRDKDAVFIPWMTLAKTKDSDWPETVKKLAEDKDIHPAIRQALKEKPPKSRKELAALYGTVLASAKPDQTTLRDVLYGANGPPSLPIPGDADKVVPIDVKKGYRKLRNEAQEFRAKSPEAPARAMALADNGGPFQPVIFLRGNPANRGPQVPLRFPAVATTGERKNFTNGSGRLELATAIADPKNPLTSRVYVNRIWGHLFGEGLVRTPSDFGVRSDPPTHPELLDWLANEFQANGGSTKKLIRQIVLARTYQQNSQASPVVMEKDPANLLLSHQTRKRHDFETLRDSILVASGTIDPAMYGRSVDMFKSPAPTRRTIYASIDRQNLPGTFRAFDFASPDQHVPQRFQTTVPQQALYLMNAPFVIDQAKSLAKRPEIQQAASDTEKVNRLFTIVFNRVPTAAESQLAVEHLAVRPGWGFLRPKSWLTATEQLAQVLLMSNEFTFAE